jgi:hypothetical protein
MHSPQSSPVTLRHHFLSSSSTSHHHHHLHHHEETSENPQVLSIYDESPDWRDWFRSSQEYQNAWSTDAGDTTTIEPLDAADPMSMLDRQSRFLLDLLHKLHQIGWTKTVDRVTTERVHGMLHQLSKIPDQSSHSHWQRAERARLLLEAMEVFESYRYQRDDEPKLPLVLPLPTHETYWRVLRMYANKFLHGTTTRTLDQNAAERCHALVQRMSESQRLELQPTAMHWNQVLSAYANGLDDERPLKAAQLLYELDAKGLTDASSFSHTLRACVSVSGRGQVATPKFEKLAISVASRVWKGLQQSNSGIDMESYHFVHMLRVSRNFHLHETDQRDKLAQSTFQQAGDAQKVNVHVLQELLQVASPKLMQRIVGTKEYSKDPLQLIHQVPSTWIEPVAEGSNKNPYEW